jgi:hypothetical protein
MTVDHKVASSLQESAASSRNAFPVGALSMVICLALCLFGCGDNEKPTRAATPKPEMVFDTNKLGGMIDPKARIQHEQLLGVSLFIDCSKTTAIDPETLRSGLAGTIMPVDTGSTEVYLDLVLGTYDSKASGEVDFEKQRRCYESPFTDAIRTPPDRLYEFFDREFEKLKTRQRSKDVVKKTASCLGVPVLDFSSESLYLAIKSSSLPRSALEPCVVDWASYWHDAASVILSDAARDSEWKDFLLYVEQVIQ